MSTSHDPLPAPPLPAPPVRQRAKPPVPPQVDVGKADVTVVLDDGEQHLLSFEGDRNGPDPFDNTCQWVTTANDQVEAWLAYSNKRGFIRLAANVYVPMSRVNKVVINHRSHLVSARRF